MHDHFAITYMICFAFFIWLPGDGVPGIDDVWQRSSPDHSKITPQEAVCRGWQVRRRIGDVTVGRAVVARIGAAHLDRYAAAEVPGNSTLLSHGAVLRAD
jgi:hypothetical protein